MTDVCPEIYGAALLLHPCHRADYFKACWPADWKDHLITLIRSVWETEYIPNNYPRYHRHYEDTEEPIAKRQKRQRSPDLVDNYLTSIYQETATTASNSDFDNYVSGARSRPADVPNVIAWWHRQDASPLVQLALNVLSIPAMSTECERLFSSASDLVGTARYALHDDTMERLELLRQWLRSNLIELQGET